MKLSRKKRAVFAAIPLLLALVAAELASRIFYERLVPPAWEEAYDRLLEHTSSAGYFPAYRPHHYTCFELNPDFKSSQGEPWHSKDGFRLPEMPRERRLGVFRIAALGGSTTHENDVALGNTFIAYLEELLNKSFPGHPVEILNAGMGSANSADNFGRFHFKVLDYSPDMVVNLDGFNDVWPMLCRGPFENDLRHARKPMETFESPGPLVTFLCRRSRAARVVYFRSVLKGKVPSVMDLTYKNIDMTEETLIHASTSALRRNLEDEAFICKGRGIELVLGTCAVDDFETDHDPKKNPYALFLSGTQLTNATIRDVASKLDLLLFDFDKEMPRNDKKTLENKTTRYFTDICHTTVRGNRTKANLFGKFLAQHLAIRWGVAPVPFEHDTTPRWEYPHAKLDR
jgi:hypothetical protein